MVSKKKDINKVIDDVTSAAKKAAQDVSKTITKENVSKATKDLKDKVVTIVDNGEKIVLETTKKVKKKSLKPELFVEFYGKQVSYEKMLEQIYTELEAKIEMLKVKSLKLYYKPEENKVYCLVNENETYTVEI
ncbi:DUF6465 family protein [Candidatus Clostridium radicumherbarum]|uniref:DUF6465 family protein n=1 Tax=Candidatus Clostridium radicumherbarum TaxID=3381662 RepID=A0ABW8TN59_9CLOT